MASSPYQLVVLVVLWSAFVAPPALLPLICCIITLLEVYRTSNTWEEWKNNYSFFEEQAFASQKLKQVSDCHSLQYRLNSHYY